MYLPYQFGFTSLAYTAIPIVLGGMEGTYRWDLLGKVNGFGDGEDTLLDGAFHIDVGDLIAEIGLDVDQAYVSVLDLQVDVGALADGFLDNSFRLDH